jgi:predicted dehydrogenase
VGADSVIITAETGGSEPVQLAAEVARDRAIVVAVGTVGMAIERKLYYEKELDLRLSRSYGPGRYDVAYEQKGRDYPIGHVRWTETRNLQAFLQFIAEGKLKLDPLITHRFAMSDAARAYDLITGRRREPFLGVILSYPEATPEFERQFGRRISINTAQQVEGSIGIGLLGAGAFAQTMLLPALKAVQGISLVGVCNATGPRSRSAAQKFGFQYCTDAEREILDNPKVHAVVIATRHHLHAGQVEAAIEAGKAVFCEKPLCLTKEELAGIVRASSRRGSHPPLMVGFNRRFAPMAVQLRQFFSEIQEPLAIQYRVNVGFIPRDHWVNDTEHGGGRILGEVCHFVDLVCFLTGSCPVEVQCLSLDNAGQYSNDNIVASLKFANGTLGTITYLANGDKAASKERIEVFGGGAVGILDDFRHLELVRHGRRKVVRSRWRQDKGHRQEMQAFVDAVRGSAGVPVSFEQIVGSTLATLRLQNSCQTGEPQIVDVPEFIASTLERVSYADREGDSQ